MTPFSLCLVIVFSHLLSYDTRILHQNQTTMAAVVRLKSLTGDVLVSSASSDPNGVRRELARLFQVKPYQIRMNTHENISVDHIPTYIVVAVSCEYVTITPRKELNIDEPFAFANDGLIGQLIDRFHRSLSTKFLWASNPHPRIVQAIIDNNLPMITNVFQANPSDSAVDWLLNHLEHFSLSGAVLNPHPKMLAHVMNYISRASADDARWFSAYLLRHPNREVIEFALRYIGAPYHLHYFGPYGRGLQQLQLAYHQIYGHPTHPAYDYIHSLFESLGILSDSSISASCQTVLAVSQREEWLRHFVDHCVDQYVDRVIQDDPHPVLNLFLRNPHPIAVEWVMQHVLTSSPKIGGNEGALANPASEITAWLKQTAGDWMYPHILANPSDDVVELIEEYITFTLPREWSGMTPALQGTIVSLILSNCNKAGAKALVFTRAVFDQLQTIDQVRLVSRLEEDECVVTLSES